MGVLIKKINGVTPCKTQTVTGTAWSDLKADKGVNVYEETTIWGMSSTDMYISWVYDADIASRSTWEDNVYRLENSSADSNDIAYGQDGNGNPKWMTVNNTNSDEIKYDDNNDITDESTWSTKNIGSSAGNARQETIQWTDGDGEIDSTSGSPETRVGCWISSGRTSENNVWIHRSVDGGANWTHLNLWGLTNIDSDGSNDFHLYALAGDGTGNWMIAQRGNLYYSSDSGVSFSFLVQLASGADDLIRDLVYTNCSWVCSVKEYNNTDNDYEAKLYSCAADIAANMNSASDWGSTLLKGTDNLSLDADNLKRMAGAGGRVVATDRYNAIAADVNGKSITIVSARETVPTSEGKVNTIVTDGTIWLTGHGDNGDAGDICKSTDGGMSWTIIVDGLNEAGDRRVMGLAPNVKLPL